MPPNPQQKGIGNNHGSDGHGDTYVHPRGRRRGRKTFRGNNRNLTNGSGSGPSVPVGEQKDVNPQANPDVPNSRPSLQYQGKGKGKGNGESSFNAAAAPFVPAVAAPDAPRPSLDGVIGKVLLTIIDEGKSIQEASLTNSYKTPFDGAPKNGSPEASFINKNSFLLAALPATVRTSFYNKMSGPAPGSREKLVASLTDALSEHTAQRLELLNKLSKDYQSAYTREVQYGSQSIHANDEATRHLELALRSEDHEVKMKRFREVTQFMKQGTYNSTKSLEFRQEAEKIKSQMDAVRAEENNVEIGMYCGSIKDLQQAFESWKANADGGKKAKEMAVKVVDETTEDVDKAVKGMGGSDDNQNVKPEEMSKEAVHVKTVPTQNDAQNGTQNDEKDVNPEAEITVKGSSNTSKKAENGDKSVHGNDSNGTNIHGDENRKSKNKHGKNNRKNRNKKNGGKSGSVSGVSDAASGSGKVTTAKG
jgi:hypothetical protein